MKRQVIDIEKIFAQHLSSKILLFRICKELLQSIIKKLLNLKNEQNI